MITAVRVNTTVSDTDMVTAVARDVVTASAEQIPRICSVTGFCRISGAVKVARISARLAMSELTVLYGAQKWAVAIGAKPKIDHVRDAARGTCRSGDAIDLMDA